MARLIFYKLRTNKYFESRKNKIKGTTRLRFAISIFYRL